MISTQCLHKLPEKKIMHKNVSKYQGFQNREREREKERERQRETESQRETLLFGDFQYYHKPCLS